MGNIHTTTPQKSSSPSEILKDDKSEASDVPLFRTVSVSSEGILIPIHLVQCTINYMGYEGNIQVTEKDYSKLTVLGLKRMLLENVPTEEGKEDKVGAVDKDVLKSCRFILSKKQTFDEQLLKEFNIINFGGFPPMFCIIGSTHAEENQLSANQSSLSSVADEVTTGSPPPPGEQHEETTQNEKQHEETKQNDTRNDHDRPHLLRTRTGSDVASDEAFMSTVTFEKDARGGMFARVTKFVSEAKVGATSKGTSLWSQVKHKVKEQASSLAHVVDSSVYRSSKLTVKDVIVADQVEDAFHRTLADICEMTYQATPLQSLCDTFELKDRSDMRTVILYSSSDTLVFGFRGSKKPEDTLTDVNILRNRLQKTTRFLSDLQFVKEHLATNEVTSPPTTKKTKKRVVFTGHSLGGSIATQMVRVFPTSSSAVIFNAGTSPLISKTEYKEFDIHSYTMEGDVVSRFCFIEDDGSYVGKYKHHTIIAREKISGKKENTGRASRAHMLKSFRTTGTTTCTGTCKK